nr:SpaH/EbpB family LPXTG-anchored major pilin [uncultured Mediterraneibacter sp.]
MKIIKKIAAIMLSVMMVLGMCSVVGAEGAGTTSGTSADKGKITIENPIQGQTYTIYQILELESFSDKTTEPNTGNYAYKVATGWDEFLTNSAYKGSTYLEKGTDGYVTIKSSVSSNFADLAKSALQYVKDHPRTSFTTYNKTPDATGKVEFTDLSLGYYLVDSTAGALCSLDTTDTEITIREKNSAPSAVKKIVEDTGLKDSNTASIGDTIKFQTTITAQPGAQNYVLHDKMDAGLTFNGIESVKVGENELSTTTDYAVESTGDGCTFHITFTPTYCESITATTTIIVTYSATLNEKAEVGPTKENKNETWLKYGENKDLETIHSKTTTKTYEIPVFKYTDKSAKGGQAESPLEGAKFILREKDTNKEIGLKSITTPTGKEGAYYGFDKDATAATEVTTNNTGKFTIQGLAPGRYELVEKEAPKGYNKLSAPVEITISSTGEVSYNTVTSATLVKVENKSGSILPSTGGMGTTLFYIFGAILVIGSGVVLITKKRMK